jgi:CelD/BcsL family acetyltransferase involved in cellulose biosynthesis
MAVWLPRKSNKAMGLNQQITVHRPAADSGLPAASSRASAKAAPAMASIAQIDALSVNADAMAAWRKLEANASQPNPFYCSWALPAALEAVAETGNVRLFLLGEPAQCRALLPVHASHAYYGHPMPHLRGWLHDNAFCGAPLVSPGSEHTFWEALFGWADSAHRTPLFLHLAQLPADGPLFAALRDVVTREARPAALVHREQRALLHSDKPSESYFEDAMSGKKRKELRRQFARLSELGNVTIERRTDQDAVEGWVEEFLTLEAAGWKGAEGSALACDQSTARLFRETLGNAGQAGALERLAIRLDGRAIAMLVNFLTPPGAFSFKTTFDEAFARFSPGVLLQRENLKLLDNPQIAWSDSCAAADHPMIERIWREKREIVSVNIGIGGALRRAAFRQVMRMERSAEPFGEA